MPLKKELLVASSFSVVFQWLSSGLSVCSKYANNTGLLLGHRWVLASASVVPVASQCTCGSSGLPVSSNYANDELWTATGNSLGDSISQCGSSVVCPVGSQWTDSIWFGGHQVRSPPGMQPLMYTNGMARVVWDKPISFELQPQINKTCNGAHIQGMHRVMLKCSHVWTAKLVCIAVQ